MRFLSVDEIRYLADAIDPRFRALILMAGFTGLRWGELVGLRVEHLDLVREG
jgi:integrase